MGFLYSICIKNAISARLNINESVCAVADCTIMSSANL